MKQLTVFFGKGMLPKSQKRQTLMAMLPRKTELLMLNLRQKYDSTLAIGPGKAHSSLSFEEANILASYHLCER
jgi:hypothetical protein